MKIQHIKIFDIKLKPSINNVNFPLKKKKKPSIIKNTQNKSKKKIIKTQAKINANENKKINGNKADSLGKK